MLKKLNCWWNGSVHVDTPPIMSQLKLWDADWIRLDHKLLYMELIYYIWIFGIYMQIWGDVKIYNSLNFENFEIPSVQSLHTAKRNLSTRGIRKIYHFEVAINTIQSWLCLVKLHHRTCVISSLDALWGSGRFILQMGT